MDIYSACGNIIGIITNPLLPPSLSQLLPKVDQLLVLKGQELTIYNQDGSLAKQCGNGLRALAVHINQPSITVSVFNQQYQAFRHKNTYWVQLPLPTILYKEHYCQIPFTLVDVGNLHALFDMQYLSSQKALSPLQSYYNVSFFSQEKNTIHIKTYEKGVGETESCGSAACAAAFLAAQSSTTKQWFVRSQGGLLTTTLSNNHILQTGNVKLIEHINI